MDDVAFRSQQFAADQSARAESHQMAGAQALGQGIVGAAQSYRQGVMQQQQMQLAMMEEQRRSAVASSELAYNEIRRQSAAEDLQWAQALHQTDMLEMDKKVKQAQAELAIAQARKAQKGLEGDLDWGTYAHMSRDQETMDRIGSDLGVAFKPLPGGGVDVVPMSPEERDLRAQRTTERQNRSRFRDTYEAADNGMVWDEKANNWRRDDAAAEMVRKNRQQSRARPSGYGDLLDNPDDVSLFGQPQPQPQPSPAPTPQAPQSGEARARLSIDDRMKTVVIPSVPGGDLRSSKFTKWSDLPAAKQEEIRMVLMPHILNLQAMDNPDQRIAKFLESVSIGPTVRKIVYGGQ